MTDDEISDDEVRRIAAKLGAPMPKGNSANSSRAVRYEAICAHLGKWHVMRVQGEHRSYVDTLPSQQSANRLMERLRKGEGR